MGHTDVPEYLRHMPAFPCSDDLGATRSDAAGMTLRDYFAAKALQGMLGGHAPDLNERPYLAETAYLMADEMLKARDE